jgi:hypothetical protein
MRAESEGSKLLASFPSLGRIFAGLSFVRVFVCRSVLMLGYAEPDKLRLEMSFWPWIVSKSVERVSLK